MCRKLDHAPLFRLRNQTVCHRIVSMSFSFTAPLSLSVEIVLAGLPEWSLCSLNCDGQLHGSESFRQSYFRWLANEEMDVLRHNYVLRQTFG